jgi:metal-responsive CopG/Arc/MetJ family transcriptional regulator
MPTVKLSVTIPERLLDRLNDLAAYAGVTRSRCVTDLLNDALNDPGYRIDWREVDAAIADAS